jgi:hypothetical protein
MTCVRPLRAALAIASIAVAGLAAIPAAATQIQASVSAPHGARIGFATVAAALNSLKARPDVTVADQDGWTVVSDPQDGAVWSFTPVSHPAYPAVVKRQILQRNGAVAIGMSMLCEGSKASCDDLERTFTQTNEQIRQRLAGG